ncbi:MAG: radical SAM protein [Desulfobacteraceae bacterium]|jgi:histone acetyltransferase (RNA polymerase elongator complex component)|nr:radical SAM protein [Desulfobacteraceae bacterium]
MNIRRGAVSSSLAGAAVWIDLPPNPAPSRRPTIVPVFLPHAGCPHRCVFCNQKTITGQVGPASGPNLPALVAHFLREKPRFPQYVELAFYGGNFLGQPPDQIHFLLAEAQDLVRQGWIGAVRFSTRPDSVDDQRLQWIAGSPVRTVELGGQSMDDAVLRASGRGHAAQDTIQAVGRLRRAGFRVGIQTMIGLPGQDARSGLVSAGRFAALEPDFVRIYPCLVLAGSPLAEAYCRGDFLPLSLDAAVAICVRLWRLFARHHIPVIRMGLQASADLSDETLVLAGPYHPAFGHLVFSALCHQALARGLRRLPAAGRTVRITAHPRRLSQVRGLGNANLAALTERFALAGIRISSDPDVPLHRLGLALD